jgi:hypothetical protein
MYFAIGFIMVVMLLHIIGKVRFENLFEKKGLSPAFINLTVGGDLI